MIKPAGRIKTHRTEVRLIDCSGAQSASHWVDVGSTAVCALEDAPGFGLDSDNAIVFACNDTGTNVFNRRRFYNAAGWDCSQSDLWTAAIEFEGLSARAISGQAQSLEIVISSDGDGVFTNNKLLTALNGTVTGVPGLGRYQFSWRTSEWGSTGGSPNMASIKNIRLKVTQSGAKDRMRFLGLWNGRHAIAAAAMTFDDGTADTYAAMQIANARNVPMTAYIIPELVGGSAAYMTENQIAAFYANGNSVGAHGAYPLNELADNGLAQTIAAQEWCRSRGYDYKHFAYPGGAFNADVLTMIANRGFLTARSIRGISYSAGPPVLYPSRGSYEGVSPTLGGPSNWHTLNASPMSSVITLANSKAAVDVAIAKGEAIIFYGHKLGAVADTATWTTADFTALCDYLQLKQAQGLIECLTMPNFYRTYSGQARGLAGPRP